MKQLLQKLGLNHKEQTTFLRLLELGAQPISVLAKQVNIPRATMYLIVENLKDKQFVEIFERVGIKYVKCIPVKDMHQVLERRKHSISDTQNLLKSHIGELEKLENKLSITPKIRFYEGYDEIERMYQQIIGELDDEFRSTFNPQVLKNAYQIAEQIKSRKIQAKEMVTQSEVTDEYIETFQSKTHQIKILPKDISIQSDTIITKEKIYMISYDLDNHNISGTEIYNPILAQTQRVMFDQVWENN